jgi:serine/threonine protein kinase/uncharacterized protein YkwD/Leucine-rich repeat (LRR) protein
MALPTNERDLRLAAVLDEALAEFRGTGRLDVSSWQARHPDLADQIPALLKTLRDVDSTLQELRTTDTAAETSALSAVPWETVNAPNLQPPPLTIDGLPEFFGRYHIKKKLGQGAMGAVYLAEDTQLARDVALKVPKFSAEQTELLRRFQREAQAVAHLRHVNICPVYDVGQIDGTHYLTMAFIDGKSLKDFIDHDKPMPQAQAATVVRKLALALAEAHNHGVVHRDLKPANIMMDKNKEPVIMDFGLAYRAGPTGERLTHEGAMMGTPAYMSPEQASGETQNIGAPTDIYALGVILYEMLTGHLPFVGPVSKVLGDIMYIQPDAPSKHRRDLDPKLEAICMQAMAKKVGERFASMADLAAALGDYVREWTQSKVQQTAGVSPAARLETLTPKSEVRSRRPPNRWRTAATILIIAVLAAAGGIVIVISDKGTVEIGWDDPDVEVVVKQGGAEVVILDKKGNQSAKLWSGSYQVQLTKGQEKFTLETEKFTLKRGDRELVHVKRRPEIIKDKDNPQRAPTAAVSLADQVAQFLELVNKERQKAGVPPLARNENLLRAARRHSNFMAGKKVLTHGPDEKTLAERLKDVNYDFALCAENLALIEGTSSDAVAAWLKSAGHRSNLLDARYTETGIGLAYDEDGKLYFTQVFANPSSVARTADPDRRAAEWVLSIGGTVRVNNQPGDIRIAVDLPKGPFALTGVNLNGNQHLSDLGLACFSDCREITYLDLARTAVGDAGLGYFKNCINLEALYLAGTKVGDAGLANVKVCKKLTHLFLQNTNVTDAGLANFRDCKNLRQMNLSSTQIGDEGLAHFKGCTQLALLDLSGTKLTDAGVSNFKDCKGLTTFWVDNTQISDAGLINFRECKTLGDLYVKNTKLTAAGVDGLRKALPQCKIDSDHPAPPVGPTDKERNERAAGAVITQATRWEVKNKSPLNAVAISGDGKLAAVACDDGTIIVYDLPEGKERHKIQTPGAQIADVVFTPDGKALLFGGKQPSQLWKLGATAAERTFGDASQETKSVAVTADGRYGLVGGSKLTLWDLGAGQMVRQFPGFTEKPTSHTAAVSSDGKTVIYQGRGDTVRIAKVDDDKEPAEIKGASPVAFAGNDRILFARDYIFTVAKDLRAGQEERTWKDNYDKVAYSCTPDGKRCLTLCKNDIFLWNVESGQCLSARNDWRMTFRSAALAADCQLVITADDHQIIRLWRIDNNPNLDRATAYALLKRGFIVGADEALLDLDSIPEAPFSITSLIGNLAQSFTDEDLAAHAPGLMHLRKFQGFKMSLTGTGFAALKKGALEEIMIEEPDMITDAGLEAICGVPTIKRLWPHSNRITDAGVKHLPKLPVLQSLNLNYAQITDKGMADLAKCAQLDDLSLYDAKITDAGLEKLKSLEKLHSLYVRGAGVTAEGVKQLHEALPKCKIESDFGTFEPTATSK